MAGARERPARGCVLALGKPGKTLRGQGVSTAPALCSSVIPSTREARGRRSEGPRALRDPYEAYSSFCLRAVIAVTVLREALCLSGHANGGGRRGVSKMSYHQRPDELRLAISSEAEALISDFGGDAYPEACRRASEASSDSLARDWSVVAATIARRSGRRSSVLDALFG